jgi:hypothetical protein
MNWTLAPILIVPDVSVELPALVSRLQCFLADDQVPCPVCNKHVVLKNINSHIDRGCKDLRPDSTRSNKSEWEKIMRSKGKQKSVFLAQVICSFLIPRIQGK